QASSGVNQQMNLKLEQSTISDSTFEDCNFKDCHLRGLKIKGFDLKGIDFSKQIIDSMGGFQEIIDQQKDKTDA
ncbi:hypothetical protein MJH12_18950, partial [bacterium]|nr:hypothetical protein [bacterium]